MHKYANRSSEPELMDDLQSGGAVIEQTLREIETINKLLGGTNVTLKGLSKLITEEDKTWRIVDIGCGGGDMLRQIAHWARKRHIRVELVGIDANPHVIAYAQASCSAYPEISFRQMDVLSAEFEKVSCDILTATLFLHHFKDEELVKLFSQFQTQARVGLVINDLHRHWVAYRSINLLTALFSKSPMVKYDAGLSVLRGFRSSELRALLRFSRITNYTLRWMWAFRWQLIVQAKN